MRKLLSSALLSLVVLPLPILPLPSYAQIVSAPGSQAIDPYGTGAVNRRMQLAVGKSVAIDLPREAKDVMVANPNIANVSVRSSQKLFLIGVALGQTNIHVLDAEGRQIVGFDVEVGRDMVGLRSILRQMFPEGPIAAEAVGDSVVLTGVVNSPLDAQKAIEVASRMVADPNKVVNALTIRGKDQVHLKVTVAEIARSATKQLGINLNAAKGNSGGFNASLLSPFGAAGGAKLALESVSGLTSLSATLNWLENNNLMRTLAEPTLTAISGESAKFLAGGEFPVPIGRDLTGNVTVEFKTFGVSLTFSPVVLSEQRISMKVGTEVSEISSENAVVLNGLSVPGLKVRRADTTLELPSGGTMVMAGLIQESTKQALSGLPGLMNVPVLGALFRSRDYVSSQTELVVMVTPYIVNPVSRNSLARPDDGFAASNDANAIFMGRMNQTNGQPVAHAPQPRRATQTVVVRPQAFPIMGHIKD
jgi:pilus assembly protein CpaC